MGGQEERELGEEAAREGAEGEQGPGGAGRLRQGGGQGGSQWSLRGQLERKSGSLKLCMNLNPKPNNPNMLFVMILCQETFLIFLYFLDI